MAELIEIGEQQERVILFAASTNASDDTGGVRGGASGACKDRGS